MKLNKQDNIIYFNIIISKFDINYGNIVSMIYDHFQKYVQLKCEIDEVTKMLVILKTFDILNPNT